MSAYDEATATKVLEDLGLGEIANAYGISIMAELLLTDPPMVANEEACSKP